MRFASLQMFFHELRQAARENRWLLTITPLVTAFTLLVYHGVIPVRFDDRLGFLRNLLNFPWPILAWIVPYLILKTPDLQDPHALWRSLPATKTQVFGSRLLLATIATVVIPTLMVAGAELAASSGHAWPQFLLMFAYQWAYLWIGAFAAFARRGHWGVGLIVLMAIAVFIAAFAVQKSSIFQLTSRGQFNSGLIRVLPYWSLAAIGGPIFALWRIRRAGKTANPFVWIGVAGACIPAIVLLENHLVLHPSLRGERLPPLRTELNSILSVPPGASGNDIINHIAVPPGAFGNDANFIAYLYAWRADLTLPPECADGRFENNTRSPSENKNQYATGSWESVRGRGNLDDFASNEAPYFHFSSGSQPTIVDGYFPRDPGEPIFSHLGKTLGLASDPEVRVPSDKIQNGQNPWRRPSLELPRHSAYFLLPNPKTSGQLYEALKGSPVRIRAEIPLTYYSSAKVICRVPIKDIPKIGGSMQVGDFMKLPATSSQLGIKDVYASNLYMTLTLTKRTDVGSLADLFGGNSANDVPQYAGLVVNRRLGQVVLVGQSVSPWHNPDFARKTEFYCTFHFPRNFPSKDGDLPQSWWDEAEFVLLESEPGPQKILPVDIEIKAPASASAK